jgi:hypothetical protein
MSNNYFNYEEVLFGGSELSKNAIRTASLEAGEQAAKSLGFKTTEAAITSKTGAAKWVIETKNKIVD